VSDALPLPGPLSGLRVLELADETGQFCGKLLGDLAPTSSKSSRRAASRAGA
jgi:hypothetical protein